MPDAPDGELLSSLVVSISTLSEEVGLLRTQAKLENDTRDKQTHVTRLFAAIAASVGIVGLIVGSLGIHQAYLNHEALDNLKLARQESRLITCNSDNSFISTHNSLVDNLEAVLTLSAAPASGRTQDQQEKIDQFIGDSVKSVERSRVKLRDCSVAGIAAYYHDS